MGIRAGISGSTSCLPASRAAAIRPMALRRTGSATDRPTAAAAPRSSRSRPGMPGNLVTASPVT